MGKIDRTHEVMTTDVLVIGSGAAGYRAATKAKEAGCDTLIIEKGSARSAGCLGLCCGMDHFCFIYPPPDTPFSNPDLSLPSMKEVIGRLTEMREREEEKLFVNPPNGFSVIVREGWEEVEEMEKVGVRFKEDDGTYHVFSQPEMGNVAVFIKGAGMQHNFVAGLNKNGIKVLNRTMAVDLLTNNGSVTGAVAVDVRTGSIKVIRSRATVIATGAAGRSYISDPLLPSSMFLLNVASTNDGSSAALAYRAGAEIINSEFAWIAIGSKSVRVPFNGLAPFALWPYDMSGPHPILVNSKGEEIFPGGKFEEGASTFHGAFLPLLEEEEKKGNGPFFWDCRHLPEEMIQDIEQKCFAQEGPIGLKWMQQRGIDLRKDLLEIALRFFALHAGVFMDENTQTNLKGLYSAGDAASQNGGGLTAAMVFGKRAGINAGRYAGEAGEPVVDDNQIEEIKESIFAPQMVKNGYEPLEVEKEVRSVMTRYSGFYKSESSLKRGLEIISDLKDNILPKVSAKNPHELMRALELRNIVLTIEMHMRASMERKESRMGGFGHYHLRRDYPEMDPEWNRYLVVRKEGETMKLIPREY
ncbi:MAG: FAD-binding protein [Deltaproteobacteria bacterium]|nr:FAD-binding protein [Deltaproteobacteria bacterium]